MDPEYSGRYRELFERHWWWRARERVILDELRRLRPSNRWSTILDVGCGDGLFHPRLAEMGAVEGVEPDLPVGEPREHESVIHAVPFDERFQPGRRYALVLMLDVLEHLDDPVSALRHAVEMLEPDGIVLVTVPAFRLLWTRHDEINRHRTRYRIVTFRRLAAEAGLRLHDQRYFFHWVFPVKLLVRLKEAVLPASPPKVPRIPPPLINRALIAISLLERRLLRPLRLPFGGSLLVVGGPSAPPSPADAP